MWSPITLILKFSLMMRVTINHSKKRMRRWSYLAVVCSMVFIFGSCDSISDFGDMNEDPGQPTEINPELQFTYIQLQSTYSSGIQQRVNWLLSGPVIQSVALPIAPYNYYRHDQAWSEHFFLNNYGGPIRN